MSLNESPYLIISLLPGFIWLWLFRYTSGYKKSDRFADVVVALGTSILMLLFAYGLMSWNSTWGGLAIAHDVPALAKVLSNSTLTPASVLIAQYTAAVVLGASLGTAWGSNWFFRLQPKLRYDLLRLDDSWAFATRVQNKWVTVHLTTGEAFHGHPLHVGWSGDDKSLVEPPRVSWRLGLLSPCQRRDG